MNWFFAVSIHLMLHQCHSMLAPLLLSFLPLVFHWFLHAALMVHHWILCCYHSLHWHSSSSFMLHQWYSIGSSTCYHSFPCYSIGSFMLHHINDISLVPLHYHPLHCFIIDSCCIHSIFHWVLVVNIHHSMLIPCYATAFNFNMLACKEFH